MPISGRGHERFSSGAILLATSAVAVVLAFTSLAGAQPVADAWLTKGIAQVQGEHWDDAVSTLKDVVKRLSAGREQIYR
jgi:hypothetical protein